jgi:hypothetical protein
VSIIEVIMAEQFGRRVVLEIVDRAANITSRLGDGSLISNQNRISVIDTLTDDFKIEFEYTSYLDNSKNTDTGSITIHNLSSETVKGFGKIFNYVNLYCGYVGDENNGKTLLFSADITGVEFKKDRAGTICHLSVAGKSLKANHEKKISLSFPKKTAFISIIESIASSFGLIGYDILLGATDPLVNELQAKKFEHGCSIMGSLKECLDTLLRPYKLGWTINKDNALVISKTAIGDDQPINLGSIKSDIFRNKATLVLNENSGLIGTPHIKTLDVTDDIDEINKDNEITVDIKQSVGKDGSKKTPKKKKVRKFGVNLKALINPNIEPNSAVKIETSSGITDGAYRIVDVKFTGDTHGGNWYMECFAENSGATIL